MATLKSYVDEEVAQFKSARASHCTEDAWAALERAHIFSQPDAWLHTAMHWHMLRYGLETGDHREVLGQFVRILVAGVGSALGKAPAGNTGRSNVGIMQIMPVPPEIAAKLDAARKG
ncbi:MAG: DUF3703 domain-containing protein [Rhodospirillaceae bacterium]|nr:DUF3703 domain-containing protein [Rhodospirillaceae bacterium]